MKIQVAGPDCSRCRETERNVINACAELNLDADISHIFDIGEFAKMGVRITPSIIVDGNIVISGKVPSVEELKKLFLSMR